MGAVARNRLLELRKESALSQTALADALGVHASTYSRWEAGKHRIPDRHVQQLAEHHGVSVAYLMGWSDDDGKDGNGENEAVA